MFTCLIHPEDQTFAKAFLCHKDKAIKVSLLAFTSTSFILHIMSYIAMNRFRIVKGQESEDHFVAWTKSEAFRKAHEGAGNRGHLYLGHPEFEGFETVDGASVG
jgi:hypothetical protein